MSTAADRRFMRRALRLAERGRGHVEPNPLVGAVVVRDGAIIAEGWHAGFGGPHAEVAALDAAGKAARGATLYVTLEPCVHHGKTPPCTDAILAAGIRRVVHAARDPDPAAAGGARVLEAQGLEIEGGVQEAEARAQNAPFFHRHERGGVYVTLKLALTLDAKLGLNRRERTIITGPAAQRAVHSLRAGFDAILVGIGTVLADDPQLTVRGRLTPRIQPRRVVLDSEARLPEGSHLAATARDVPVWVFVGVGADPGRAAALEARGIRVFRVPAVPAVGACGVEAAPATGGPATGGLDIAAVLATLAAEGVRTVLCEGGGRVASALLAADRVERMHLFYAPRVLGTGVAAFPSGEPFTAGDWRFESVRRHGRDVLLTVDRARGA